MNTVPTLFLDFDGPLHSVETQAFNQHGEFVSDPNLFKGIPTLDALLKPFPSLQIVVSSDWRLIVDDEALVRILGPLAPRFAGVVEVITPLRAEAVQEEARRRRLSRWLALDDHPSVVIAAQSDSRFIACDSVIGISALDVQQELVSKITNLLNAEPWI